MIEVWTETGKEFLSFALQHRNSPDDYSGPEESPNLLAVWWPWKIAGIYLWDSMEWTIIGCHPKGIHSMKLWTLTSCWTWHGQSLCTPFQFHLVLVNTIHFTNHLQLHSYIMWFHLAATLTRSCDSQQAYRRFWVGCLIDPPYYNLFRVFSPDCTLHTAITHVISVLERSRLTHDYAIGIHVRLNLTCTFITWVIAECNVHSGLKTLKRL